MNSLAVQEVIINMEELRVSTRRFRFPTLALGLLAVGVIWLLNDLDVISIDIPWVPIIVIIIAVGMIFNKFLWK